MHSAQISQKQPEKKIFTIQVYVGRLGDDDVDDDDDLVGRQGGVRAF